MRFFGALAKEKKKTGCFVAWEFSRDAMEYIADMKRDHKVDIIPMKCIDIFSALLLDPQKGQEIEKLYKERYPKEWLAKKVLPASAAETKRVLDKAQEIKNRLRRGRDKLKAA